MSGICYRLVVLLESLGLVGVDIPLEGSPKMDLLTRRVYRVIEGEGDPQGKPSEKVINGVFMRVSEDLKEHRGLYLGKVEQSPGGE